MRVLCNVDRTQYKSKPTKEQTGKIQYDLAKPEEIELQDLYNVILMGGNYRPAAVNGMSDKRFVSQQIFCADIDNKDDYTTPEKAIDKAKAAGLSPNFVYPTFSDSPAKRRYRILFVLDCPVIDCNLRNRVATYITGIYGGAADNECNNPARLFYGTDKPPILADVDHVNKLEDILAVLPDQISGQSNSQNNSEARAKTRKRGTLYNLSKKHSISNIDLIKNGNVEELRKRLGSKETKVFENTESFLQYVYAELDIAELLEINTPKSFCCIFHDDRNPSASIFTNRKGNQCYKCFSCGLTINAKQIIEKLMDASSEYRSLEFIKNIYNLRIKETDWSIEQKANIDSIINCMTAVGGNGFADICPTAAKTTRNAGYIYLQILNIARNSIRPEKISEENIVFPMSIRQLARASGKSSIDKTSKYIKMLLYHAMLEIVPDSKIPAKILQAANAKRKGDKHCHTNFYQIPSWVYKRTQLIETRGVRWKNQNYRLNGISYELFYRNEGADIAKMLYPQTATFRDKNGTEIQRATTEKADELTMFLAGILLNQIEQSGYTTEANVIKAAISRTNYKMADTQIKRSINEMMDTYELQKIRANKAIKQKYGIDGKGYPLIIIHA